MGLRRGPPQADRPTRPARRRPPPLPPQDSISLSPTAQQALAGTPDGQKTPLQSALEKILTAIRSTDSPTLSFSTAPDIGKNLDQSC